MRPQTVSLYMNGQSLPDVLTLRKIADYYGVSADWLLDREGAVKVINADLAAAVRYTGLSEEACKCLKRDSGFTFYREITSEFILTDSMGAIARGVVLCRKNLTKCAVQAGILSAAKRERRKIDEGEVMQRLKVAQDSYKVSRYEAAELVLQFVDELTSSEKNAFMENLKTTGYDIWLDLFTTDKDENNEFMKKFSEILEESRGHGEINGEHPKEDN